MLMSNQFVNYAFTTTLYKEEKSLLEAFSPVVLKAFYDVDDVVAAREVVRRLEKDYDLLLPENTVRTIINALSGQRLLKEKRNKKGVWRGGITKKGCREVQHGREIQDAVRQKQTQLLHAIIEYLEERDIIRTPEYIQALVLHYIKNNQGRLSIFGMENSLDNYGVQTLTTEEEALTSFLTHIQKNDPTMYDAFEELVKGCLIHNNALARDIRRGTPCMEPLDIYLDVNTFLSLLQLHHPFINKWAGKLLTLLKSQQSIRLKIFSITLHEAARVLKLYMDYKRCYHPHIPVNNVFYYMRSKSFDNLKTDSLIDNLDREATALGITVEGCKMWQPQELIREDQEMIQEVLYRKSKYNSQQPKIFRRDNESLWKAIVHDATVILAIREMRSSRPQSLERAQAVFLSSSHQLSHHNRQYAQRKNMFPEVILDHELTNRLWLKNPEKPMMVNLNQLISINSRQLMTDNRVWTRFVSTLKELRNQRKISPEQLAAVYRGNVFTCLYLHNADAEDISHKSILRLTHKVEQHIKREAKYPRGTDTALEQERKPLKRMKDLNHKLRKETYKPATASRRTGNTYHGRMQEPHSLQEKEEAYNNDDQKHIRIARERERKRERERDCRRKDYVCAQMCIRFYSLGNKIWHLLYLIAGMTCMYYLFEASGEQEFVTMSIPIHWQPWLRGAVFIMSPLIYIFLQRKQLWLTLRYHFTHKKLRKKYEKRFENEFDQQERDLKQ